MDAFPGLRFAWGLSDRHEPSQTKLGSLNAFLATGTAPRSQHRKGGGLPKGWMKFPHPPIFRPGFGNCLFRSSPIFIRIWVIKITEFRNCKLYESSSFRFNRKKNVFTLECNPFHLRTLNSPHFFAPYLLRHVKSLDK